MEGLVRVAIANANGITGLEVLIWLLPCMGHFLVYAQQLKLFRRDVERLTGATRRALGWSKLAQE